MSRDEWDVLMKLLARSGEMIPMDELLPGSGAVPRSWRQRGRLQATVSRLRAAVTEAGVEIRHDGWGGKLGTAYGLFDLYAAPSSESAA